MRCPHCAKPTLEERRIRDKGVRVDLCTNCNGVWYDSDELQQLMSVAEEQLHMLDQALPSERLCPRCLREMFVFDYPQTDVAVDMCGHCRGLWLDVHEARRIKTARKQQQQADIAKASQPSISSDLQGLIDRVTSWMKEQ